jgi:CHAT domain-containing protein
LASWNRPIPAVELVAATQVFGPARSDLITRTAFTDSAIEAKPDLDTFRILHFATHGVVTAPREGCPAQPALLTSFGGSDSDGLLEFSEIFNLDLDADLVILSACDTASAAGLEATRAAGIENGGGQALDGLVRAFIGAGGRQVIASHWPAPEDYDATARLFQSFFRSAPGTNQGDALRAAQAQLMDDPETSHPFYWAGFALIGDGERPLFSGS